VRHARRAPRLTPNPTTPIRSADFTGKSIATIHLPVRVPFGLHGAGLPT
jgi:hypothetical protein